MFGYLFIFQLIASSYVAMYPKDLLVALGLLIGVGMVIAAGYGLLGPDTKRSTPFSHPAWRPKGTQA
ncbi:MAG: hypothetical protein AB1665_00190 [Candidatus Thermoplasmatota archaeon]